MEKIDGERAGQDWVHLSDESKRAIITELRSIVAPLRVVSPPADTRLATSSAVPNMTQGLPGKTLGNKFSAAHEFHRPSWSELTPEGLHRVKSGGS